MFGKLRTHEVFQNDRLRLQFKWDPLKWPPRDEPSEGAEISCRDIVRKRFTSLLAEFAD